MIFLYVSPSSAVVSNTYTLASSDIPELSTDIVSVVQYEPFYIAGTYRRYI